MPDAFQDICQNSVTKRTAEDYRFRQIVCPTAAVQRFFGELCIDLTTSLACPVPKFSVALVHTTLMCGTGTFLVWTT